MALLVQTLLLVAFTSTVNGGISCYTCSSRNNSDIHCQDPFNPYHSIYTEDCMVPKQGHIGKFPANFCVKVIGNSLATGENLVIRTCVTESMDSQCGVFRFQKDTLRGCVLTCDFDGCNGAGRFHLTNTSLLIIWSLGMILWLNVVSFVPTHLLGIKELTLCVVIFVNTYGEAT